jgi:hypothetical protein
VGLRSRIGVLVGRELLGNRSAGHLGLVAPSAQPPLPVRESFASLNESVGARLRLAWRGEFVWELRQDDRALAELDLELHVLRGHAGVWRLESVARTLVARPANPESVTAAYYPRRLGLGGTIALSNDESFTLTHNPFADSWRVIDRYKRELLRLERSKPIDAGRLATPIELSLVLRPSCTDDATVTATALLVLYIVFAQPLVVPTGFAS